MVFRIEVPSSQALTLVGSGLTGIGLGATVAPALFVAGFSLPSANLQRVFAIVELLRAVAAFMVAPIFVYFAANVGSNPDAGTGIALWIGLGLAVVGAVIGVALYALGGARPQTPDLDRFLAGESPAWYSPPLLAASPTGRDHGAGRHRERRLTMAATRPEAAAAGPVLFAYDGSELAQLAIEQAGRQLAPGRDAVVLCVWQPADVGFVPVAERHFDAQNAAEVQQAAEETAAHGASLAEHAGFRAQSLAVKAAPTWKGIVTVAEEHQAEPDRARLPPPHRHHRAPPRQRHRRRARPLGGLRSRRPPTKGLRSKDGHARARARRARAHATAALLGREARCREQRVVQDEAGDLASKRQTCLVVEPACGLRRRFGSDPLRRRRR